jgi:hypothetical protein
MTNGRHGSFWYPKKSPWSFEKFQGDLERQVMVRLESDRLVKTWTKRHGITIPWIDGENHERCYVPDFYVEYEDGKTAIVEVAHSVRIGSNDVQRKRKTAEIWCRRKRIAYIVAGVD